MPAAETGKTLESNYTLDWRTYHETADGSIRWFRRGGVVAFFLLWGVIDTKPLSAMEQMAENVRKATSYKYTQIVKIPEDSPKPGKPAIKEDTRTCYWLAPGLERTEYRNPDGQVELTKILRADGPGIDISHSQKSFVRLPASKHAVSGSFSGYETFGNLAGEPGHELGTKEINGKKARGVQERALGDLARH